MKAFVLVMVLYAAATAAFAQQSDPNAPASKEDVEKYLAVVNSHDMMAKMASSMSAPMHQMMHDQFLKYKDKLPADFEQKELNMIDDMFKDMPFDEMVQAMVPVYQKHFTKADIDALIAFYSAPTGQKVLREMPAIMSESMTQAMPLIEKYMETMQQRVQDELAQALKDSEKKQN